MSPRRIWLKLLGARASVPTVWVTAIVEELPCTLSTPPPRLTVPPLVSTLGVAVLVFNCRRPLLIVVPPM